MLKLEHAQTYGWEAAVRGMRNPMNSWDKSDSGTDEEFNIDTRIGYLVGENDFSLMKKLTAAGTDHAKFLRMLIVTVDLTAPLYWWKEYDTYKVGTVANSCSTMHKIQEKEFVVGDFSHEHLFSDPYDVDAGMNVLQYIIDILNIHRDIFLESNDKDHWWQMIQLLPSSYNQKRAVYLNYAVLRNIYHSRKNHKLDEWRTFCNWIESLPYSELIMM